MRAERSIAPPIGLDAHLTPEDQDLKGVFYSVVTKHLEYTQNLKSTRTGPCIFKEFLDSLPPSQIDSEF